MCFSKLTYLLILVEVPCRWKIAADLRIRWQKMISQIQSTHKTLIVYSSTP